MEKAYKTMQQTGAGNIALGIVMMIVGVTTGILAIVNGARLLKNKSKITF